MTAQLSEKLKRKCDKKYTCIKKLKNILNTYIINSTYIKEILKYLKANDH